VRRLILIPILLLTLGLAILWLRGDVRAPISIEPMGSEPTDVVTLLFFGDSGTGHPPQYQVAQSMARICKRLGCDLALMLGDNVYSPGPLQGGDDPRLDEVFGKPFAPLLGLPGFRIYSVAGNHDLVAGLEAEAAYAKGNPLWEIPGLSYAVPGLPDWLHVFGLFTPPIFEIDEPDAKSNLLRDWRGPLREAEAYLCDETRQGWKILFGHYPIYSTTQGTQDQMVSRLLPVIRRCGVDLYLAGHAHQQEHIRTADVEQFIQGAAALPRHTGGWFKLAPASAFLSEELGFGVLRVSRESLWVNFFEKDGAVIYSWRSEARD